MIRTLFFTAMSATQTRHPPSVNLDNKENAKDLRLYVETYGCQMNEYDSGIIKKILSDSGFVLSEHESDADVILLNTCAIREKAHERIYTRLQSFSGLKRRKKDLVVGVLGCMAQNLGDDLFAMGLPLDMIVGPDNYRRLPELIHSARKVRHPVSLTRLSLDETYEDIEPSVIHGPLAYLTIMRGCDNFCSFCVVPYTRGRERSRSPGSIVSELKLLIEENGIREVTLLGQNVNSYRYESEGTTTDFTGLVRMLLDETEISRIRFTSPHPHHFPLPLLELMAREERFCSQLHLPVQSGSTSVLERMKRDYSREEYLDLVNTARKLMPDAGITTDVIVGFPGETEEEFEMTLSLIQETGFDMAYMFKYSQRELTLASKKYPDDVPEEVKTERLNRLISAQRLSSAQYNRKEEGKIYSVLVEGKSKKSDSEWMGRTAPGKVVIFPAPPDGSLEKNSGTFVQVKITGSSSATLKGEVLPL